MYHHFIPISSNTISYKKKVLIHVLKHLILFQKTKIIKRFHKTLKKKNYIACFYDEFWWAGIAQDVSELDIKVRFVHPHEPVKNFFWLARNDEC